MLMSISMKALTHQHELIKRHIHVATPSHQLATRHPQHRPDSAPLQSKDKTALTHTLVSATSGSTAVCGLIEHHFEEVYPFVGTLFFKVFACLLLVLFVPLLLSLRWWRRCLLMLLILAIKMVLLSLRWWRRRWRRLLVLRVLLVAALMLVMAALMLVMVALMLVMAALMLVMVLPILFVHLMSILQLLCCSVYIWRV
jgi:hypothetical protein